MLYAGYLLLRRSIDEPHQRGRIAAVYSLFAFFDVPIVWFSIRWWRTQHPQPMQLPPEMWAVLLWNWLALILFAAVLVLVRVRQEEMLRQIKSVRRVSQAASVLRIQQTIPLQVVLSRFWKFRGKPQWLLDGIEHVTERRPVSAITDCSASMSASFPWLSSCIH